MIFHFSGSYNIVPNQNTQAAVLRYTRLLITMTGLRQTATLMCAWPDFRKSQSESLLLRKQQTKNTKMKVKLCKVYTLECQLGDDICFRHNKIREFDTLERQRMGVNKYASTFPMASCNKKRCNHRKRKQGVKNIKIRNLFLHVRNWR